MMYMVMSNSTWSNKNKHRRIPRKIMRSVCCCFCDESFPEADSNLFRVQVRFSFLIPFQVGVICCSSVLPFFCSFQMSYGSLEITCSKRKIIWTKPPFLGSMLIFSRLYSFLELNNNLKQIIFRLWKAEIQSNFLVTRWIISHFLLLPTNLPGTDAPNGPWYLFCSFSLFQFSVKCLWVDSHIYKVVLSHMCFIFFPLDPLACFFNWICSTTS